jgi:hypothetical protein
MAGHGAISMAGMVRDMRDRPLAQPTRGRDHTPVDDRLQLGHAVRVFFGGPLLLSVARYRHHDR